MCESCHRESDDDYEGESMEEKRTKATQSIVSRHPELGISPDEIAYRFAPKAEWHCVRVSVNEQSPTYEIHDPAYGAVAMSSSPSLSGVAIAAWIETGKTHEEICEILDITSEPKYGAFFVSDEAPLNPSRADNWPEVDDFEQSIQNGRE